MRRLPHCKTSRSVRERMGRTPSASPPTPAPATTATTATPSSPSGDTRAVQLLAVADAAVLGAIQSQTMQAGKFDAVIARLGMLSKPCVGLLEPLRAREDVCHLLHSNGIAFSGTVYDAETTPARRKKLPQPAKGWGRAHQRRWHRAHCTSQQRDAARAL